MPEVTSSRRKTYLNTRQAAEYLGRSPYTLRNWRLSRKGPTWINLGRPAYDIDDLNSFVEENKVRI